MRLVIFDVQNPIDPQVNGLGFYRTVVDGSIYLRIARVQIPTYTTYSLTAPWEAADISNEGLALVGPGASYFTFGTDTAPTGATSTQIWEIEGEGFRNSEDFTNGYRGMHLWEKEYLTELNSLYVQTRYTWAFASILEDDELGVEVETDNDIPPFASLVAAFQEHVFVAGDPDNPHHLYWSKRFRPEAFPLENFIEVGNADDPIMQITPIAGVLGVFTKATKYRATGNAASGFVHWEALSHRGTLSPKSVVATDQGVIFVSPDGVWVTNFIASDQKLSEKIEGLFASSDADSNMTESTINKTYLDQVVGGFFKSKYYFCYPSGTATTCNRMAVYDFATHEWTIYDHAMSAIMTEFDTNLLVAGGTDGNLYVLETGKSDDGTNISYDAKTKDYYEGKGTGVKCLFLYFTVDAKIPTGESITAKFIVDGSTVQTATITGDRLKELNRLPEGCIGYRWQVQLSGSTHKAELEVSGVAALYLPLGTA
jgi:hypothetical protein